MAYVITQKAPAAAGSGLGLLDRVREGFGSYRLYRRTIGELNALTDRELGDIGVTRVAIRDLARASVYGA